MLLFTVVLAGICGGGGGGTGKATGPETGTASDTVKAESEPVSTGPGYETAPVAGLETVAILPVEAGPKSVELMPGGARIFVNDLYAHKCFIFDAGTYQQLAAIPLPDEPVEAAFSEGGRLAWVSLYNSSKVLVIDTRAGAWVYVANWNSNTVTVIDAKLRAKVADVPVPGTPRGICFSPSGDFAYVCIMGGSELAEIDVAAGHRISRHIPCGSNPRHVVVSRDGNVLFVSNNGPGTVTLVDRTGGLVIDIIKVGGQARTIALAPDGRYLFVCNYGEDTVGCVDLFARTQLFTVTASRPIGMTVSARGDRLFISNYAPPQVTVMRINRR